MNLNSIEDLLFVWTAPTHNFFLFSGSYTADGAGSSGHRGKKKTLEELFKPPLDIMFKGDWQSVRDSASAAKKWLIVNIQASPRLLNIKGQCSYTILALKVVCFY